MVDWRKRVEGGKGGWVVTPLGRSTLDFVAAAAHQICWNYYPVHFLQWICATRIDFQIEIGIIDGKVIKIHEPKLRQDHIS